MLSFLNWKKLAVRLAAVAALAAFLGLPAGAALAHAKEPKVTPAHGSALREAPEALSLSFARPVRLTAVRLYDGAGSEIDLPGKRSIEPAKTRRIALPPLQAGDYRVEWRALSSDGHPVDGAFGFSISSGD
jgi:methionine-rich copper-binding protein CopC